MGDGVRHTQGWVLPGPAAPMLLRRGLALPCRGEPEDLRLCYRQSPVFSAFLYFEDFSMPRTFKACRGLGVWEAICPL